MDFHKRGQLGGAARAQVLDPQRRREIASKAGRTRWARSRPRVGAPEPAPAPAPTGGFLVYVAGLRGPEPQKWPEILRDAANKARPHIVAHELTAEQYALPLNRLVELRPPPPRSHP